jgi:hypothetical protein
MEPGRHRTWNKTGLVCSDRLKYAPMVVRIRVQVSRPGVFSRNAALLLSTLMTPLALAAWVLGVWRLAADAGWMSQFAIGDGPFSRWQVWMAVGIGLQFASFVFNRVAGGDDDSASLG